MSQNGKKFTQNGVYLLLKECYDAIARGILGGCMYREFLSSFLCHKFLCSFFEEQDLGILELGYHRSKRKVVYSEESWCLQRGHKESGRSIKALW